MGKCVINSFISLHNKVNRRYMNDKMDIIINF